MMVSEIQLYEMLKGKIGEKEAEAFINILETKVDRKFEEARNVLATKEDIAKSEARLTIRMFYFWIGQVGVIAGILFFFFKSSGH
jgi:hypothetical protein